MHKPEEPESADLKALWRDQPGEKMPVPPPETLMLRGRRLHAMTRSDILSAVGATIFLAAILVWRLGPNNVTIASLALMSVWIAMTLLCLRRRVWGLSKDELALTGVEFYRRELEHRSKHLRNAWLWHAPLILACVAMVGVAGATGTLAYKRLAQVSPLLIALVFWTAFTVRRRRRDAATIQRELDDLAETLGQGS